MRLRTAVLSGSAVVAVTASAAFAPLVGHAAGAPAYTVQTLHFAVSTGPTGGTPCDIIGDLYTPATASATNRVPAILTTNGFGGSKNDQAGIGAAFASRGFEVLSYSGLGFGGSTCKITLDDPDYDGRAASQLVSYLGGAPGIAFTDAAHTQASPPLDVVVHDAVDHSGVSDSYDPRVGMIGGSYGGEIQFATADVDPRVDTIVPLITWNDLTYSLDPNNTAQTSGVSTSTPGAIKLNWGLLFSADGALNGLQNAQQDPSRLYPCPNFADFVCPALVTGGTAGYFQPDAISALRHASVATYLSNIRIPVLLIQGENDTLFNLNEASATYQSLLAQHTPVSMIWQSWGHSNATPAPGEVDLANPDPATQYETGRILAWFQHYLLDLNVATGPEFAYFRDWISYSGNAAPAYATSSSFPVGTALTYSLSGLNKLISSAAGEKSGFQTLLTPPAGAPTTLDPLDVLGSFSSKAQDTYELDPAGTADSWSTGKLTGAVDVAGSPTLTIQLSAPSAAATQATGPAGQLVLFVKVIDVAPNGTASLIREQVAPIRVPDVTAPFTVTLPGIVHRFAAGHIIRLVIAGGSPNYRGGLTPVPVTISSGAGQRLTLPIVP